MLKKKIAINFKLIHNIYYDHQGCLKLNTVLYTISLTSYKMLYYYIFLYEISICDVLVTSAEQNLIF